MNTNVYSEQLGVAIQAATKAGEVLVAEFGKKHLANFKTTHDIGLEVDKSSEKVILGIISSNYPSHNIYSEEIGAIDQQSDYTWFIDPLDGTNNFYAGIGYFGVSIALMRGNEIVVGVVNNPITKQLYFAEKGYGATLNGEPISPSKMQSLDKAVLAFIRGHRTYGGRLEQGADAIEAHLTPQFRRTLKMWAPALDWCLLASGGIDALVSFESEVEDQYAGTLIAQEAGAAVFGFDGEPYSSRVTRIFATNPFLKDSMIEMLRQENAK